MDQVSTCGPVGTATNALCAHNVLYCVCLLCVCVCVSFTCEWWDYVVCVNVSGLAGVGVNMYTLVVVAGGMCVVYDVYDVCGVCVC